MKVLQNECLAHYTSTGIGGVAKKMYFPKGYKDLIELANLSDAFKYVIGGGSNILINDRKTFDKVISLKELNNQIVFNDDETVLIGCSVTLQKAITTINKKGYGGIEYLFSVPALIGGAIAMNAGRGYKFKKSISDYIVSITAFDPNIGETVFLDNSECDFEYRNSIFKRRNLIILEGTFKFDKGSPYEFNTIRRNRIIYSKKLQDYSGRSFGSVFNIYNKYIMQMFRILSYIDFSNARYSRKTSNWIVTKDKASYLNVVKKINRVELIHKIFGLNIRREVKIWD